MRILALCLLAATAAHAATLAERIDRLLEASPAGQSAFWGIQVIELGTVLQGNFRKIGELFFHSADGGFHFQ